MKNKPMKHQEDVIEILNTKRNFGILHEMGLGKTFIMCNEIEKAYTKFPNGNHKTLIIAPNSVLDTWYNEIETHTDIPMDRVCIPSGSTKKRIEKFKEENIDIFIVNYEALRWIKEALFAVQWNIKIADESQRLKSPKAIQTKIAMSIRSTRTFILSGTPILGSYLDVFSQWQFLDGGETFGNNFYGFRNRYFYDATARQSFPTWKMRVGAEEEILNKMLGTCHRLEKKDCLTLPEKVYEKKYAEMTPEQSKAYTEMKNECITFIQDEAVTAQQALTKLIRLNQITSGFMRTESGEDKEFKKNAKLELLKETVEEILTNPENKIIVWAHFRHDIELLQRELAKYNPVVMYGGTKDRGKVVEEFQQSPHCKIFIGQPHSAGLGITLTRANYAIYFSYNFSLEDRLQSEDRCHRKGSEIHTNITYIDLVMKDTIDDYIIAKVRKKEDLATEIMDFLKDNS